ncbi:uncharacterized protein LOC113358632 isoform X2 [Papaver somniferum]|uniref:uncharacterized protein LOC113358632 isoform X2 n=1 Tax=Papaver somniferum TaxID=3469 RepID=UPI000E6F8C92|nr:uncharacterized protein LOC113358632 isoform X2 [Papaver somniferum]
MDTFHIKNVQGNSEYLMKLVFLDSELLCMDYFYLHFGATRSLFDRARDVFLLHLQKHQTFDTRPQQNSILWTKLILSLPSKSESRNELYMFSQLLAGFRFFLVMLFPFGSFILHLGSISIAYYTIKKIHELINEHEFACDTLFCASVILVSVKTVDCSNNIRLLAELSERNRFLFLLSSRMVSIRKSHTWFSQVFGRNGAFFFLQLPCEFLKGLAAHLMCLKCIVESEGARIPVSNSASAPVSSCCIQLWSLSCGAYIILLPSAALVFHVKLLMVIVDRRKADLLRFLVPITPALTIARAVLLGKLLRILKILLQVRYLKWEFKLFPTGWWNGYVGSDFLLLQFTDGLPMDAKRVRVRSMEIRVNANEKYDVLSILVKHFTGKVIFLSTITEATIYHGVCKVESS